MRWGAICVGVLLAGCATAPVRLAEGLSLSGWFEVDARAAERPYAARFFPATLQRTEGCEGLPPPEGEGPVLVLVPGVHGDGPEWEGLIPRLSMLAPASVYMFRWVPYDARDALVERLAEGLTRLARCSPEREVIVLAHSAGGVLASYAAGRLALPLRTGERPRLVVLTVASPLAGTQLFSSPLAEGRAQPSFFFDLGAEIFRYPPSGPGVEVYHLRTQYPADRVMRRTPLGGLPNDRSVKVPGARQIDLPPSIGHVEALGYVAQRLVDGTWSSWRRSPVLDVTVY